MKIIITENQLSLIMEQGMGGMVSPNTFAKASSQSVGFLNITFESFMENIREGMGSLIGAIGQTILAVSLPGIGSIINASAWALLTIYDISKGITNKGWNWLNIIIDLVGTITSAGGGRAASAAKQSLSKLSKFATGTIETFLGSMKKYVPKFFGYVVKLFKGLSSVISKISNAFLKVLNFLKSYKNSSIYKGLYKLYQMINTSAKGILTKIESAITKNLSITAKSIIKKGTHVVKDKTKEKAIEVGVERLGLG